MPRKNPREEARKYLDLPNSVVVRTDETVGGNRTYIARIRELQGCLAQGDSVSEAMREVREALVDYVATLLEDGLPVPLPASTVTFTSKVRVSEWPHAQPGRPGGISVADTAEGDTSGATVELVLA